MRTLILATALLGVAAGASAFEVVGPTDPKAWERTAVTEFTNWFGQVCANGTVRVDGLDDVVFHIGDTDFAKEKGLASSAFRDEEWCIRSFATNVVLNGGGTRGALYAVYHFLEDECGVRWWNDDDFDVPTVETLDLPKLDRTGRPFFRYRDIYRDYKHIPEPETPVRLRLNGNGPGQIPLALGGGIVYGPPYLTHTFGRYLPFETYGKEHPEWYSYHKKTGKREGAMFKGQFCLSNPELFKVMTEKVRESVKKGEALSAQKGIAAPKIYSLVMNDNKYPCECEACLAEVAKRGYSGQMVRFANAIAAEVGRDHPDIFFKTTAYLYTETPPTDDTRARDNVLLDIATTTENLAGPVDDPGFDFVRSSVEGWRKHAKNLFIWTYQVTFGGDMTGTVGWPFPSEYFIPGKIRFYADCGACCYFAEQEYSKTADMYELKLYLQRKLAEDPYQDGDALRNDFMRRYYGPAGEAVAAARQALLKNARDVRAKLSWFPRRSEFVWLTDGTLDAMRRHFAEAERLVGNDAKRLRRVKVARLSADRVYESRSSFRTCGGKFALKDLYLHDKKGMSVDTNGVLRLTGDAAKFNRKRLLKAGISEMKSSVTLKVEGEDREGEWTWYSADVKNVPLGYFYFCDWWGQLATGLPEQVGKNYRLRLHARLRGPAYYPGSRQANLAEIDAFEAREFASAATAPTAETTADLIIYGATPAGIAAAVQAKRMGVSAIVLEPTKRIGGLTTGGLGQTDIGNKESFGGIAREFYAAVRTWYADPKHWTRQTFADYAPDGQCLGTQGKDTMWTFEPSAALAILEGWEMRDGLAIHRGRRLDRTPGKVKVEGQGSGRKIVSLRTTDGTTYTGKMFMDCSYEGDLMAAAGIPYVVGREANAVYGETVNGIERRLSVNHQMQNGVDAYVRKGDPASGLLPGVEPEDTRPDGAGDDRVQAYCFRMCLTDDPENRIPFAKPDGYRELDYELLLRNLEAGPLDRDGMPWINSKIPNRKTDTNNRTGFSTDLIGGSSRYPEASDAEREEIVLRHLRYQQGLMWTLANHPRVPENIRREVSRWGTCRDEFVGERGDGWQNQLYVREARRMVGEYVMTERECLSERRAPKPIALAAYGMDSHNCRRYVDADGKVRNEGNIEHWRLRDGRRIRPYPIGYGALVPKRGDCANLLVPVCLSASHMAFGSIRMEPVFFALGQSAATAAALAIQANCTVQNVPYDVLRARLVADGQRLDPPPDSAKELP